jgi:hypothetical protein|eukprot:COSAG02_NODE_9749_length_2121_cov_3.839268_2_plen_105_part_00
MLLACVIDGGVSDHELQLLSRTRLTIEPSDAWPATMSGDDKTLHEDVLDSLIEERCRTWAGVIRNGGHTFVRVSTCLMSMGPPIVLFSIPPSSAAGNGRQRRSA